MMDEAQLDRLCINTLRTFSLIVLAILGPLVFGLAVFDGFGHTLTVWLARYINVFLWLPVAAWQARGRSDLRVIPVTEKSLQFAVGAGVRRRDPGLAAAVDGALERLLGSGEARAILTRYGAVPVALRHQSADSVVLAQASDPADRGRSLFSTACSRCHGAEGVGGGTGGAVPKLKNYDGGWDKFSRLVLNGRKNTAMGGFKGILTEDEVRALYEYLTARARE